MKILHTSDWHLGQKFISRDREEEHRLALDWLLEVLVKEHVDLLLVAGDIFDIGNPSNSARSIYYNFLRKVLKTNCRHVVIVSGNHDSPQMLDAPAELLQLLDIHVVGSAQINPEVLVLKDKNGNAEIVVAAIPFLRDHELNRAIPRDSPLEYFPRIQEAIADYYRRAADAAAAYIELQVPLIATGHLFASGAFTSGKQDNIYQGNLENITADRFPEIFDYVALGHIHRAQAVAGINRIRYSGSLIPLSFSETKDDKSVTLVEFEGPNISAVREIPVPLWRRLKTIQGDLSYVQQRLLELNTTYQQQLTTWVDVLVDSDTNIPNLSGLLQDFTSGMNLDLLKVRLNVPHASLDEQVVSQMLDELEPLEVFKKKCESAGSPPENMDELIAAFRELEEGVNQAE
ncbi:MAG: hypothetical protein RI973_1482 [Bacteroidota bacterium]|jgi:exonuclease SbcD